MGSNISKAEQVLFYYSFQQKMNKYLKDWKHIKDKNKIKTGYFIHPDWIKEWKRSINYEQIKTVYLNNLKNKISNVNDETKDLIQEMAEQNIINLDDSLSFLVKNSSFITMVNKKNLTLEYLENFINKKTYNLFNINEKTTIEKIEYIFKQKILIFFIKDYHVIKLLLFDETKIKFISLKFIINYDKVYEYFYNYFKEKSSKEIINFLSK